jgi:hypothetical protein
MLANCIGYKKCALRETDKNKRKLIPTSTYDICKKYIILPMSRTTNTNPEIPSVCQLFRAILLIMSLLISNTFFCLGK